MNDETEENKFYTSLVKGSVLQIFILEKVIIF